jgi:hypothetical protein
MLNWSQSREAIFSLTGEDPEVDLVDVDLLWEVLRLELEMIWEEHILDGTLSKGGGFRAIAEISWWSVATTVAWPSTITIAATTAASAFLAVASVSVSATSLVAATPLVLASMHLFFGTSPSRSLVLPPPDSGVPL